MVNSLYNIIRGSIMWIYVQRMVLALLLSSLVGLERERENKSAGLRDTMLVCFGATLFAIISIILRDTTGLGVTLRYDISRIIAYTIASVGFLGSGVILQSKSKSKVEGITTAAMLWTIVGVGILTGLGFPILSTISAIFIYIVLKLKWLNRNKDYEFKK